MSTAADLMAHCILSIRQARIRQSKLGHVGEPVNAISGFIGDQTRHLFNCLGSLTDCQYLEVGVLHGASLLSTCYGNQVKAIAIDDWSGADWHPDPAKVKENIKRFQGNSVVRLIEQSCWEVDASKLPAANLFYYDGDHSQEATARAFTHFLPCLADPCIVVVDDYSWPAVSQGLADGLQDAGLHRLWETALFTHAGDAATYWNGVWIGVVSREPK